MTEKIKFCGRTLTICKDKQHEKHFKDRDLYVDVHNSSDGSFLVVVRISGPYNFSATGKTTEEAISKAEKVLLDAFKSIGEVVKDMV